VLGAYAGWRATDIVVARVFTWSIRVLTLAARNNLGARTVPGGSG
jgi:hypothetical protein